MSIQQVGITAFFDTRQFNSGVRQYQSGLKDATQATQVFNTQINNVNMSQFNSSVSSTSGGLSSLGAIAGGAALAGIAALTAAVTGLVVGMVDAVGVAAEFEQGMANLAAVSGKGIEDIGELRDLALDLSVNPELTVSATGAAEALSLLAKNGVSAEDMLAGVGEATIALANATGTDFSKAADIATDAMNIWGVEAENFTQVADNLTGVVVNSKFDMQDMSLAMSQGGAVAESAGVSFDEFNAIMASTASRFSGGSQAGTAFKVFLSRMQAPTDAAKDAMDALGISLFDTEGNARDILDVWEDFNNIQGKVVTSTTEVGGRTEEQNKQLAKAKKDLEKVNQEIFEWENNLSSAAIASTAATRATEENRQQMEKTNLTNIIADLEAIQGEFVTTEKVMEQSEIDEMLVKIFGTRGIQFARAAMGTSREELEEMLGSIQKEGQAAEAAATRTQTFQGAMERLRSAIQLVKIQIGDLLLPSLTALLDKGITPLTRALPTLAGIAGAAFSRVASLFGGFGQGIDLSFLDGITDALAAFNLSGFGGMFQNLGFGLEGLKFGNMLEMAIKNEDFDGVIDLLLPKIQGVLSSVFASIGELNAGFLGGITTGFLGRLFGVETSISDIMTPITNVISQIFTAIQSAMTAFQEGGTGGLAEFLGIEPFVEIAGRAAIIAQNVLLPIFPALKEGAIGFFAAFQPIIPQMERLAQTIQDNAPGLTALAATLGGSLIVAVRLLGEALGALLPIVGTLLANAFELSLIWAGNFITALGALGEGLMAIAEGDLTAFINAMGAAGTAIVKNFLAPLETDLGQRLLNTMAVALSDTLNEINPFYDSFNLAGAKIILAIAEGIKKTVNIALKAITDAMRDIYDKAIELAADFVDIGYEIMEFIGQSILDNIGAVQGALGDAMQAAIDAALGSIGLGGGGVGSSSTFSGSSSRAAIGKQSNQPNGQMFPSNIGMGNNITNVYNLNVSNSLPGDTIRNDFELMRALA